LDDDEFADGELLESSASSAAEPERRRRPQMVKLFMFMRDKGASDLHIKAGRPPMVRMGGTIRPLDMEALSPEQAGKIIREILTPDQEETLRESGSVDFAYEFGKGERVRVNAFHQRGALSLAARLVNTTIPSFDQLNLPPAIDKLTSFPQGLVLVCGVTGSGKSTTLAAVIQKINETRRCHILTIEDPIEFVYEDAKSFINQREVGLDVFSWTDALRAAVREDPDVILVGEMRDPETFSAGLSAAETGHLVFGTLHASNAAQTFGRIYDMFPPDRQGIIRQGLAFNLNAIIGQKLIPSCVDGMPVAPAVEIMFNNATIRELIRKAEEKKIPDVIKASAEEGMQDFTMSLVELVNKNLVGANVALELAPNREELQMALRGFKMTQRGFVG